jgi:hypothetical protein
MTTSTVLTMVLILGFVWGGFALALFTAVQKESEKGGGDSRRTRALHGFSADIKQTALDRQDGRCAFCGVGLATKWTKGSQPGEAHHLRPVSHRGKGTLDNCVYLCRNDHLMIGHGVGPEGVEPLGGGFDAWVQVDQDDFPYWGG